MTSCSILFLGGFLMVPFGRCSTKRWLTRTRHWLFTLSCLGFVFVSTRALGSETPPWTQIHAQHFVVLTDAGDKRGREVALRFEQMRAVFGSLLMKSRLNMSVPLSIIALKSDQDYARAAPIRNGHPTSAFGFLLPGEDRAFIVLNLFENDAWRGVAHDFAHLLLNYNYPPTQGWFDEGFAEYFSSIRLNDKQVQIGGDPELQAASEQAQARNPPKSLTELLSGATWLSLPDLFATRHEASPESTQHTLFYAESWMVAHYLINKNLLPQTGDYFDLVQNQMLPVDQAITKAFGMSPAQLEEAVKTYFHSFSAPSSAHEFPTPVGPDDVGMTVTQVPDADARALLGDVMARIPEHHEQAVKDLQTLAADPVNSEAAHRALAWSHIERKEFEPASEELGNAAELNQRDLWVRYYLSVLKYRMAQTNNRPIQGLANMMQDLRAVLDWYPEFAEAYNMLAMARVEGGGPNSALEAMRAALQLTPRNEQYVYNLGVIYASAKKWDAARAVFERLEASSNPEIASAASNQLNEMKVTQKYGIAPQQPASTTQATGRSPVAQSSSTGSTAKQETEPEPAEAQKQEPKPAEPTRATGPIQFVKGKLVSVDCSQAPAAMLTVMVAAKTLTLRTPDYKSLTLIGVDSFSCAWTNRPISANYRARDKTSGDLVSLEVH
jgi:tetratricopeptide (TPR) repeat protein